MSKVVIRSVERLAEGRYRLERYTIRLTRRDGGVQEQAREIFDRGDGAAILLYDARARTVVLIRQFRLPAYLAGVDEGMLIEAPAGKIECDEPLDTIRRETMEETGYAIERPEKLFDAFMSPGAVTERIHFFCAPIEAGRREGSGGGLANEGEDIEVLDVPFDEAMAMIADGRIRDAKTIILLQHAKLAGLLG